MRVVVLVPWRGGDERREATWAKVLPHLSGWGWPVLTGDKPGPWNRSGSINIAAQGPWDVAVIADADTIHERNPREAVALAYATGGAVVPWDVRWRLSPEASVDPARTIGTFEVSEHLDPNDGWAHNDRMAPLPLWQVGSTIVVSRRAWDAAGGGMDEGFVGWGFEDCAHRIAMQTLAPGGLQRMAGTIYHLWHRHDLSGRTQNSRRFQRYVRAAGNPEAMARLVG